MSAPTDECRARLNAYRDSRADLYAAVAAAADTGMIPAEIARESGLTRQWVARIIRQRLGQPDDTPPAAPQG